NSKTGISYAVDTEVSTSYIVMIKQAANIESSTSYAFNAKASTSIAVNAEF
ncbi:21916_t:CDS:1, partial [Gigaspora margarita]